MSVTALGALLGLALLAAPTGAAPNNNSLSGNVGKQSGLGFNGTVISDGDGTNVRGAFKVNLSNGGNITVDATCLQTGFTLFGRAATAAGEVKTSTDPSVPRGAAIEVRALDSDDTTRPDGLEIVLGSEVPGPNQCGVQLDPPEAITKGKITVKIGF